MKLVFSCGKVDIQYILPNIMKSPSNKLGFNISLFPSNCCSITQY